MKLTEAVLVSNRETVGIQKIEKFFDAKVVQNSGMANVVISSSVEKPGSSSSQFPTPAYFKKMESSWKVCTKPQM